MAMNPDLHTTQEPAKSGAFSNRAVGFALRFAVLTALALVAYDYPYADGSIVTKCMELSYRAYARASGALVMLFDAHASVRDNVIPGRFPVSVNKGCDGIEVQAPLVAAILAFPAPWRGRLVGAGLAIVLIWVVNIVRIATLYFAGTVSQEFFELMHVDVWPVALVVCAAALFLIWVQRQGLQASKANHA